MGKWVSRSLFQVEKFLPLKSGYKFLAIIWMSKKYATTSATKESFERFVEVYILFDKAKMVWKVERLQR